GYGTVFMVTTNGALTTLAFFNHSNGARPFGGLTLGANGAFYGTAASGGTFNSGTIFKFTPNDLTNAALTLLYSFAGKNDGAGPQAGLTLGRDGNFYGTAAGGGTNSVANGGCGTIFKIKPDGSFTSLASLARGQGVRPFAPLTLGSDGKFYGTATAGGASSVGTIFSVTPAGAVAAIYGFTGAADGANPAYAGLVQGPDGNFYGTASVRGGFGHGTFFRLSGFRPLILSEPASQTVPVGSTVTFSVAATGSAPFTYRWRVNGSNLVNDLNISGAATPTLTLRSVSLTNAGNYSVVINNAAGQTNSATAVLTVIGKPGVTILSPAQKALTLTPVVAVAGQTSGKTPVAQVYWQLNGTGWQMAATADAWANWRANVIPQPGTNFLEAYAVNIVGLSSPTTSVTFISGVTSAPVVVQINGQGTLSPNMNNLWLAVGRRYTMTAKAGSGCLFSNWVQNGSFDTPVSTSTPTLTFTMQSNLVIQANFVPNPYLPVSGAYNGLYYDPNKIAPESCGSFSLVTTPRGTFSGSVRLGGARYPVSGQFDWQGNAQTIIYRRALEPLVLRLRLDLTEGSDQILGTLAPATNATWSATVIGDRAVYNGLTRIAPQAGRYTLALPGNTDPAAQTAGDSYGTVIVDKAGMIHLAGALADGTKISQAVPVSKNGQWPLYVPLYAGQGTLVSWLTFTDSTEALSGDVTWVKPALPAAKYYPLGFTNEVSVLASQYIPPAGSTKVLSLTNAQVVFDGGNLLQSVTNQITLGSFNKVKNLGPNKCVLTITPANGVFTGSVVDPATAKLIPFSGVVLQNQNLGCGYFLGTNQSGRIILAPTPSTD
ncbi:MAG TPA: choice-of-anchor tandem repeat GloVer-containing protein, partial [Candidatus Sulfotelmatobacter sp.]|nr:choice-of-anchor tandem repeat GloVer-containing protein [Candidatus Sulfotelmatobacter sp.]